MYLYGWDMYGAGACVFDIALGIGAGGVYMNCLLLG